MNVLIVEDEKLAREQLATMLTKIEPTVHIMDMLDSVAATVEWLKHHTPELIFLDIHLADDLSFSIFDQQRVTCPIIFTTAYDHYALRAFEVNSIAYLLKPIEEDDLKKALDKYQTLRAPHLSALEAIRQAVTAPPKPVFQKRFLVKKGEKLLSVPTEEVAYFEGEDRYVTLVKKDGNKFFVDYKLADLEDMLNPELFFRLNRSFICHIEAIQQMSVVSKSRVMVGLAPAASRNIVVSTERTRELKAWLNR